MEQFSGSPKHQTKNDHFSIYPKELKAEDSNRYLYTRVQSSTVHSSLKVKTIQVPIHGWTEKQNVVYPHNGILFSLKKEGRDLRGGLVVKTPSSNARGTGSIPSHGTKIPHTMYGVQSKSGGKKKEGNSFSSFFIFWHHIACKILVPQPGIVPRQVSAVSTHSPNCWTAREFPGRKFRHRLQHGWILRTLC